MIKKLVRFLDDSLVDGFGILEDFVAWESVKQH